MTWIITIDQRTPSGATQRHGPFRPIDDSLCGAVEDALVSADLVMVEVGSFQITATPSAP